MNLPTRIKHAFAGILGLLALLTAHAGPSARKLRFDHLSVTDGLSQMSVVSVVQDADGYLWFGTRDGLNRYDGYDFRIFRHELHDTTSISDSYIRCMANDRDGRLWVGTTNGLNRYDPRTERFARYYIDRERHTGNINEINAICADPAGGVWLGTYEGLYHLGRDEAQARRFERIFYARSPQQAHCPMARDSLAMIRRLVWPSTSSLPGASSRRWARASPPPRWASF